MILATEQKIQCKATLFITKIRQEKHIALE